MNKTIITTIFVVSLILGSVLSCEEDCPKILRSHARGVFPIDMGFGGAPDNGTVDIRDTEVEILYKDKNGNDWSALYKIVKEE